MHALHYLHRRRFNSSARPSSEQAQPTFPMSIPTRTLTAEEMTMHYGLGRAGPGLTRGEPELVDTQIEEFLYWSRTAYRFDRGERYTGPVQHTTTVKQRDTLLSMMGFFQKFCGDASSPLSLSLCQQPALMVELIGFLMARGATSGHVSKHISLARKVNTFLAGQSTRRAEKNHAWRVEKWFSVVAAQVSASMPKPPKKQAPQLHDVYKWVESLGRQALSAVDRDQASFGHITKRCAKLVQEAIIAILVTGQSAPPLRLSIVKTVYHPKYSGCADQDCRVAMEDHCPGNRFELIPAGES